MFQLFDTDLPATLFGDRDADDAVFDKIVKKKSRRTLCPYFSEKRQINYELRDRCHNMTLLTDRIQGFRNMLFLLG